MSSRRCKYDDCQVIVHGYRRFCKEHVKQRIRENALRLHAEGKLGCNKGSNNKPILYPAALQTYVPTAIKEQAVKHAKAKGINVSVWLRDLIHQKINCS